MFEDDEDPDLGDADQRSQLQIDMEFCNLLINHAELFVQAGKSPIAHALLLAATTLYKESDTEENASRVRLHLAYMRLYAYEATQCEPEKVQELQDKSAWMKRTAYGIAWNFLGQEKNPYFDANGELYSHWRPQPINQSNDALDSLAILVESRATDFASNDNTRAANYLIKCAQAIIEESGSKEKDAGIWLRIAEATILDSQDQPEQSNQLVKEAHELACRIYGEDHFTAGFCLVNLGIALKTGDSTTEGQKMIKQGLAIMKHAAPDQKYTRAFMDTLLQVLRFRLNGPDFQT